MSCGSQCSVVLALGAMGWSAVCDSGISGSYSLVVLAFTYQSDICRGIHFDTGRTQSTLLVSTKEDTHYKSILSTCVCEDPPTAHVHMIFCHFTFCFC